MPPPWIRKVPVCYAMCAFHYLHDFIRRPGAVYTASLSAPAPQGLKLKTNALYCLSLRLPWKYIVFNRKISPN